MTKPHPIIGAEHLGGYTLEWTWSRPPQTRMARGMGIIRWTLRRGGWQGGSCELHGTQPCSRANQRANALRCAARALDAMSEHADVAAAACRWVEGCGIEGDNNDSDGTKEPTP